jgi:hypothetical protein
MALIANFPQKYLDEHIQWHTEQMNRMPMGTRPGSPGYGDDFLSFHEGFISRVVSDLTRNRGLDPGLFAPWIDLPDELKSLSTWPSVRDAYSRIVSRPYTFTTSDAFGLFLDSADGIHRWVHNLGGTALNDPSFSVFEQSPQSTTFYRWHGLITKWWERVRQELSWPRMVDWQQLLSGDVLPDNDIITATIEENALGQDPHAEPAVEFVLASDLWWWKELNVPDGETGSSWNIHTGAGGFWGGRRFNDSVALWAHQVRNGQILTFKKAKTLGLLSNTYKIGGLEQLPPLARVTFRWIQDSPS